MCFKVFSPKFRSIPLTIPLLIFSLLGLLAVFVKKFGDLVLLGIIFQLLALWDRAHVLRYFNGRPHSELRTIVFVAMLLSQVGAEPFDRVPNCRYTGKLSFSSNEIVMKRYWTPFGALWCLFDPLLVTPSMSSHLGVGFGSSTWFWCASIVGTFWVRWSMCFWGLCIGGFCFCWRFLDSGCSACSVCRVWEILALGSKWSLGLFNLYIFLFYRNFLFLTRFV